MRPNEAHQDASDTTQHVFQEQSIYERRSTDGLLTDQYSRHLMIKHMRFYSVHDEEATDLKLATRLQVIRSTWDQHQNEGGGVTARGISRTSDDVIVVDLHLVHRRRQVVAGKTKS